MSTSCGISIRTGETLETIYCHNDGYPSRMLPLLRTNYGTLELAAKLISFGDASSIYEKLEPTTETHSFDEPEDDVCIFYHRDRNEDWNHCKPCQLSAIETFKMPSFLFVYVFEDGTWNCYKNGKRCG